VGIAAFPEQDITFTALLESAEKAMASERARPVPRTKTPNYAPKAQVRS
jgi:hypothetical protein